MKRDLEDIGEKMQRRPSTQDITWLIDLHQNGQLDLDPPYQRRSVWTPKDRRFFLDTIFRNYPSPAIFLHKTISDTGKATYHVVDGKQRTETILSFVNDKIRMAQDFGDTRLNGKKWSDLEIELKQRLWNYQITVEMIDFVDSALVNAVFERLNRNSRKLTEQELRHAKFDGWFITEVESEASREEWRQFGVVIPGRTKRMLDVQFISELMLVLLEGRMMGFNQAQLDELYAKYDDPEENIPNFDEDAYRNRLGQIKDFLKEMEAHNQVISKHARSLANLYTLWCIIAFNEKLQGSSSFADSYKNFMEKVETLNDQEDLPGFLRNNSDESYNLALRYLNNAKGATTDFTPRNERYQALISAVLQ